MVTSSRERPEMLAIARFIEVADELGFEVSKGQGNRNRIPLTRTGFQFGDLRVDTSSCHVIVETESAGGVNNLVKYWYLLDHKDIQMPVILLHLFAVGSDADYQSHLDLWDFMAEKMTAALGDRFRAWRFTYRSLAELEPAVIRFRQVLEDVRPQARPNHG